MVGLKFSKVNDKLKGYLMKGDPKAVICDNPIIGKVGDTKLMKCDERIFNFIPRMLSNLQVLIIDRRVNGGTIDQPRYFPKADLFTHEYYTDQIEYHEKCRSPVIHDNFKKVAKLDSVEMQYMSIRDEVRFKGVIYKRKMMCLGAGVKWFRYVTWPMKDGFFYKYNSYKFHATTYICGLIEWLMRESFCLSLVIYHSEFGMFNLFNLYRNYFLKSEFDKKFNLCLVDSESYEVTPELAFATDPTELLNHVLPRTYSDINIPSYYTPSEEKTDLFSNIDPQSKSDRRKNKHSIDFEFLLEYVVHDVLVTDDCFVGFLRGRNNLQGYYTLCYDYETVWLYIDNPDVTYANKHHRIRSVGEITAYYLFYYRECPFFQKIRHQLKLDPFACNTYRDFRSHIYDQINYINKSKNERSIEVLARDALIVLKQIISLYDRCIAMMDTGQKGYFGYILGGELRHGKSNYMKYKLGDLYWYLGVKGYHSVQVGRCLECKRVLSAHHHFVSFSLHDKIVYTCSERLRILGVTAVKEIKVYQEDTGVTYPLEDTDEMFNDIIKNQNIKYSFNPDVISSLYVTGIHSWFRMGSSYKTNIHVDLSSMYLDKYIKTRFFSDFGIVGTVEDSVNTSHYYKYKSLFMDELMAIFAKDEITMKYFIDAVKVEKEKIKILEDTAAEKEKESKTGTFKNGVVNVNITRLERLKRLSTLVDTFINTNRPHVMKFQGPAIYEMTAINIGDGNADNIVPHMVRRVDHNEDNNNDNNDNNNDNQ